MSDKTYKILLVDDNSSIRRLGEFMLQEKYEVITGTNGKEAVEFSQEEVPDLILMDLNMPKLDGLEAAKEIRANPKTESIPIMIVSGQEKESEFPEGLPAEVDAYVVKPFDVEALHRKIEEHLNSSE
ncbi:MAG: response regulator [Elusimicrobiota bacterium]